MVILQFNKLIRNKWVWGVFAIVISAAFCFEELFSTREAEERKTGDAGMLGGKVLPAVEFEEVRAFVRDFIKGRDAKISDAELNKETWKICAALRVAEENGVKISDEMLAERIRMMFSDQNGFSSKRYEELVVGRLGMTPKRYEDNMRRAMTLEDGVRRSLIGSSLLVSPQEVNRKLDDETDKITIRIARIAQSKAEADAVKVDDVAIKKWYDGNSSSLALPERAKIRFIRYDAANTNILAKMTVSDDEMHDFYDASVDRWTSTDTNGVETVKKFEEVKGEIEKELRKIAAVEYFETNLQRRAYANAEAGEDMKASRLDKIAKEDGKKVQESGWFPAEGGKVVPEFMTSAYSVLPGARNFLEVLAELDPSSPDLRYGIASSENSVWIFERSATSPAHTPSYDEAKDLIKNRVLRHAKDEALKSAAAKIIAKGVDEVLKVKEVSTNITFVASEIAAGTFADQRAILPEAIKLYKGEVSDFVLTGAGRGAIVVCTDRVKGDIVSRNLRESQVRSMLCYEALPAAYDKWLEDNLQRMGFEPNDMSFVDEPVEE